MNKKPVKKVPSFRLVPATRRDFAVWKQMRADLYTGLDESFNRNEMERMLGSRHKKCLLVKAPSRETVGFLEVSLRNVVDGCVGSPVGYIEGIYLVPGFRGLGLGPVLLETAQAWFRDKGCREMATDTEIDNEPAQEFWSGLGFEETWRIVQYRKSIDSPRRRR